MPSARSEVGSTVASPSTLILVLGSERIEAARRTALECLLQGAARVHLEADPNPAAGLGRDALVGAMTRLVDELDPLHRGAVSGHVAPFRLGPRWASSSALDRAFTESDSVIVLSAGAVPRAGGLGDFVRLLERFATDAAVGQIVDLDADSLGRFAVGSGQAAPQPIGSVAAPLLVPRGAWGTWRDRWERHEPNVVRQFHRARSLLRDRRLPRRARINLLRKVAQVSHGVDEFIWTWLATLRAEGLGCVAPPRPLFEHEPDDGRLGPEPTAPAEAFLLSGRAAVSSTIVLLRRSLDSNGIRQALRRGASRSIGRLLLRPRRPILIASAGRAGSSMLFDAVVGQVVVQDVRRGARRIVGGLGLGAWIGRSISSFAVQPSSRDIRAFRVIKTHAGAGTISSDVGLRAIFTHAPSEHTTASLMRQVDREGSAWIDRHAYHLGHRGSPVDFIVSHARILEDQETGWKMRRDTLSVPLDRLWEQREQIASWLGLDDLPLPTRR